VTFRPALIPTIATFIAVWVPLSLGNWQWNRHKAQEVRIEQVREKLQSPPVVELNEDDMHWRHAILIGTYQPAFFLVSGRFDFGSPGYDVIQPMLLPDGTGLLVNRGFVRKDDWADLKPKLSQMDRAEVQGVLLDLSGDGTTTAIPADDFSPERWPNGRGGVFTPAPGVDYTAMAKTLPFQVAPVYLTLGPELGPNDRKKETEPPVGGYYAKPKEIGHYSYAMQWWMIAFTLIAVWAGAGFHRGRKLAKAEAP